jgi:hypothetical protein
MCVYFFFQQSFGSRLQRKSETKNTKHTLDPKLRTPLLEDQHMTDTSLFYASPARCGLTYTCLLSLGGRSWALKRGAVTTSSGSSISPDAMATSW